ncbi:MAG: c-type cytochrome domain-containing protein [Fidelibacterota bacterium]
MDMGIESTQTILEIPILYSKDIQPIFDANCIECHGNTSGLSLTSYDELINGGDHGNTVIPGNSNESVIIQKLGESPPFGDRMPSGLPPLDPALIDLLITWIDSGAENN